MDIPINYLAVIVAAFANMALGMAWYGSLFGKAWMKATGRTEESMKQMNAGLKKRYLTMNRIYALQTVGALLMAYVLAHVLVLANVYSGSGLEAGLKSGFGMWLGFVAPVSIGVVLWDGMPWKVWFIQGGYFLAALLMSGAILGYWQ